MWVLYKTIKKNNNNTRGRRNTLYVSANIKIAYQTQIWYISLKRTTENVKCANYFQMSYYVRPRIIITKHPKMQLLGFVWSIAGKSCPSTVYLLHKMLVKSENCHINTYILSLLTLIFSSYIVRMLMMCI